MLSAVGGHWGNRAARYDRGNPRAIRLAPPSATALHQLIADLHADGWANVRQHDVRVPLAKRLRRGTPQTFLTITAAVDPLSPFVHTQRVSSAPRTANRRKRGRRDA